VNRGSLFPPSTPAPLAGGTPPVLSARPMTALEEILERHINDAYSCLVRAQTLEGKRAAWNAMVSLCRQRTAERILQMHLGRS
jgi:hypothetical protein